MDDDRMDVAPPSGRRLPGFDLPLEQWLHVFSFLSITDLYRVMCVNRDFFDLSRLQSLWKPLLVQKYSPLILKRVINNGYREMYRILKRIDISGDWHTVFSIFNQLTSSLMSSVRVMRARALPYVNIEVMNRFRLAQAADGFRFYQRYGVSAYAIQVGAFVLVLYDISQGGIVHLGMRELSLDGQEMSGPFSDIFFQSVEHPTGFVMSRRLRESIRENIFNEYEVRENVEEAESIPLLQNSWKIQMMFDSEDGEEVIVTDYIQLTVDRAFKSGAYFGKNENEDIVNPTAMAVVCKGGAIGLFRMEPAWPPTRTWMALCWVREGTSILDGYCFESANEVYRTGKLLATIVDPNRRS